MSKEEKALLYAEEHGIIKYKVKGNRMIYYRTMYNSTIRCIDLKAIDFSQVKYQSYPLDESKKQPVEMVVVH